jgi:hypothetical protein
MTIAVDQWLDAEDWDFPFVSRAATAADSVGTKILITDLNATVARHLGLDSFRTSLLGRLGSTYALFLRSGIRIRLNGREAESNLVAVAASENLQPAVRLSAFDGVEVIVVAGVTPTSDRFPRGWYVFCNGRMVVEASRDKLTGWGDGLPRFAGKYNHFVGFVYFRSDNPSSLPWTTTKESIEVEAPVYQRALGEMRVAARPVLRFLADAYKEETSRGGRELSLVRRAEPINVAAMDLDEQVAFRAIVSLAPEQTLVPISYAKPLGQVQRAKDAMGNPEMSDAALGEATFDYFYERAIGDE